MKTLTRLLATFAVALLFLPACNKDKPKPLDQSFQPETVDMGGSVLWASFNLGATDRLEMGLSLAWGEWAERDDGHQQYYRFYDEAYYENHFEYTAYNTEDGQTTLLPSDDPATLLLGGDWRVPTEAELKWLVDNTTAKSVVSKDDNEVGVEFTSKVNGNVLYFPLYHTTSAQIGSLLSSKSAYYATASLNKASTTQNVAIYLRHAGIDAALFEQPFQLRFPEKHERHIGQYIRPVKSK